MMKKINTKLIILITSFAALFFACLAYAYFIEPNRLVVKHDALQIKDWDAAFDGLKIVMIGDIHGGSNYITEEKIREIVAKTNAEQPDLIVLLGDYISEKYGHAARQPELLKMPIETVAANLASLNAKLGVYAVLGNHDGWYGDDRVAVELTKVDIRVLRNEVATVETNGKFLRILGLIDHLSMTKSWQQTSDEIKQIINNSGTGPIIILEHSPDILPIITGELSISPDLRLILAAHTHGGQVWLPIFGTPIVPSSYGQKYSYGHIRENGVDMFVTSGVGTSVLPIRFMMPPEIAVLTIKSE